MSASLRASDSAASSPRTADDKTPGTEEPSTPRPLLPRPQLLDLNSSDLVTYTDASKSARRQRSNVTLACNECKSKKSKCDGQQPCGRCIEKKLHCYYDHNKDRRRIRGNSAGALLLAERLSQYQRLLFILRDAPGNQAVKILHHLRSSDYDIRLDPDDDETLENTGLPALLQYAETIYRTPEPMNINDIMVPGISPSVRPWFSGTNPLDHPQQVAREGDVLGPIDGAMISHNVIDPQLSDLTALFSAKPNPMSTQQHDLRTHSHQQQPSDLVYLEANNSATLTGAFHPGLSSNTVNYTWPHAATSDWERTTTLLNEDIDRARRLFASDPTYATSQSSSSMVPSRRSFRQRPDFRAAHTEDTTSNTLDAHQQLSD